MNPSSAGAIQIFLLLLFIVPAVLFMRIQHQVLALVRPENRQMHPALVWLQFIPVFALVWIFIVVTRIANSLAREFAGRESDSIFELADEHSIKAMGKPPTYRIGMAFCILVVSYPIQLIVLNLFGGSIDPSANQVAVFVSIILLMFALMLAALVCWIVYWVQLVQHKNKLKRRQA